MERMSNDRDPFQGNEPTFVWNNWRRGRELLDNRCPLGDSILWPPIHEILVLTKTFIADFWVLKQFYTDCQWYVLVVITELRPAELSVYFLRVTVHFHFHYVTTNVCWWQVVTCSSRHDWTVGDYRTLRILPCCSCPVRSESSHARWWTSFWGSGSWKK
jgi:hypothetical protein